MASIYPCLRSLSNALQKLSFFSKAYCSICLLNISLTLNKKHINLQNINPENKGTVFYNDLKSFFPSHFSNSITKSVVDNLSSLQFFCVDFLVKHRDIQRAEDQYILWWRQENENRKVPAKVWILRERMVNIFECLLHVKYCSKYLIWMDFFSPHDNLLSEFILLSPFLRYDIRGIKSLNNLLLGLQLVRGRARIWTQIDCF